MTLSIPKFQLRVTFGNSPINHALTAVAQEVSRLLQHANPVQADGSNHAETIAIRAIEPE